MKQELYFSAKTVELALEEAAQKLECTVDQLTYEVVEQEKSGFLGIGSAPAKIKVERVIAGDVIAKEFIDNLLSNMEIEADVEMVTTRKSDRQINIVGDAAGVLIGHHGDTLEALQYLTNLAANKREEDESRDYVHITVDVENYRSKRETTLRSLARRMAAKVQKTGKSVMLEPMSPYERRIIHSEVQSVEGVSTNSIGQDSGRRVVIYLESEGFSVPQKKNDKPARRSDRRGDRKRDSSRPLISTYGSKDKSQQREQPKKFKDFNEYINSLLGH